ncbi:MAG TPA: AAA family ATPase, partial [Mycobacteriales bacterium]|nr:AAA family ATPase [Mycobacteriales bacterium]
RGLSNLERGLVGRPRRASLDALAEAFELTDRDRRRLFEQYRPVPLPVAAPAGTWRGPRSHLRELVGRETELAELADALREHDLVTVTGPGGCGKTAIALAAAASTGRAVTVLGLASLATAEQLVPALASTLQVEVGGIEATLEAIERELSGGGQLLVVDNAEHLAEAVADAVIRLRGGCPGLTMLVTSREPLGVSEELVWRLRPLRPPADESDDRAPAAVLFRRRTQEALPTADLTDAGAVGRVCRRLDGLPLALELAAARVRALTVPQLADRLDRDLAVLDLLTSAVPGPSGRRTLEDTIDWSYRLLDPVEQRALAQLSVFRGGFTPEAVEAVVSVPGNPVAIAAQLVDRSLLQAEPGGGRYVMLRTIRDYAAQRLAGSGELVATRRRHLEHWLQRARRLTGIAAFGDRLEAARAMSDDLVDAEHALAGGVEARHCVEVVELAHRLADCWNVTPGYVANGERWLAVVDQLGDRAPARLRALARTSRGQLLSVLGEMQVAQAQLRAALRDSAALTTPERLDLIGMTSLVELGTLDPAALGRADQLLAEAASCPDDHHAAALSVVVDIELQYGRVARAAAVSVELGALVERAAGWLAADHHGQRARLAAWRGDEPGVWAALAAAQATADGLGAARRFRLRLTLGEVLLAVDAADTCEHLGRDLRELVRGSPEARRKAPVLNVPLAEALRRQGRRAEAAAALRAGLTALRSDRQGEIVLGGVLVAAAVRQDAGDTATAAELAAEWQRVRLLLGLPVPPAYRRTAGELGLSLAGADPARARPAGPEMDALLARATDAVPT